MNGSSGYTAMWVKYARRDLDCCSALLDDSGVQEGKSARSRIEKLMRHIILVELGELGKLLQANVFRYLSIRTLIQIMLFFPFEGRHFENNFREAKRKITEFIETYTLRRFIF